MTQQLEAMKLALEALELAQDNLRDHGDNCFLHDEGEYNRCFCGKDSLSNHLQSCVEELDQAIEQAQKQEPVAMRYDFDGYGWKYIDSGSGSDWQTRIKDAEPVFASAPQRQHEQEPVQIAGFDVVIDESMPPNKFKFEQAQKQEAVLWLVNGVVQSSDLPKDYTGCLYTSPPQRQSIDNESDNG